MATLRGAYRPLNGFTPADLRRLNDMLGDLYGKSGGVEYSDLSGDAVTKLTTAVASALSVTITAAVQAAIASNTPSATDIATAAVDVIINELLQSPDSVKLMLESNKETITGIVNDAGINFDKDGSIPYGMQYKSDGNVQATTDVQRIGGWHIWQDANSDLRIKESAPATDLDGEVWKAHS